MSYDTNLADRIRSYFEGRADIQEKHMFGGLAFMLHGHMCVGATEHRLMARVGPKQYTQALSDMHATIMDFTGKPLNGFVYVEPEGFSSEQGLSGWIAQCENFVDTLPPKGSFKEAVVDAH